METETSNPKTLSMAFASCPHYILLLLFTLSTIVDAQTYRNISLGSSLSADDENPSWVSPSAEFAFGFRRLPNTNQFLLAVWFDKIPEKTVVWSANGDTPVQRGSKVELTNDGRLILSDPRGTEIKSYVPSSSAVAFAAMLDTGNFVLASADSAIVWESFGVPTDTILPSQILGLGTHLSSHLTETNYSKGRFHLGVQLDGNLVIYPVDLFTGSVYPYSYWSTATMGSGFQLVFNASTGNIYFTQKNGSIVNLSSGNMVSTKDFYHRATLDFDGGFRQYVYPKNSSSSNGRNWEGSWSAVWYVPENLCTALVTRLGGGICGYNSYCKLDDKQRASCYCPFRYSYLDPNNPGGGCIQAFTPQACGSDHASVEQFEIIEMLGTDWPESDFEQYRSINEDQCRRACLSDCFCAVAYFEGGTCTKKKLPLANGKMDPSVRGKALLKVQRGNFSSRSLLPPRTDGEKKEDQGKMILVGSLLLGTSGFLNLFFFLAITVAFLSSRNKNTLKAAVPDSSTSGTNLRCFTYDELTLVTDGFKEELGRGSFGSVYKGVLGSDSGSLVAVKKLNKVVEDGEKEFKTEVTAIARTHHKNLVQLLGFCDEGAHRLLVYEFMSNGSLASFLFGNSRPDWNQRMQIASGIARGLMYLHEDCNIQIIHCDIKPQNILLDDNFTPRISDFGLAKLLKTEHSRTNTSIRGTRGYVATEWFRNMAISVKVDVYSFGVMLMEIIFCRKIINVELGNEDRVILTEWAYDCYKEGTLNTLLEDDEAALIDSRRLERTVKVAIWCIQEDPSLRPSMKKVTQMLEGSVEVSVPPNPSSFFSSFD